MKKKYYLNPKTGQINAAQNWEADWEASRKEGTLIEDGWSLRHWSVGLIEVKRTKTDDEMIEYGEWMEVT